MFPGEYSDKAVSTAAFTSSLSPRINKLLIFHLPLLVFCLSMQRKRFCHTPIHKVFYVGDPVAARSIIFFFICANQTLFNLSARKHMMNMAQAIKHAKI
jgi:hypothetical protein